MPVVLGYHPWPDAAWKNVIDPFLRQQAIEEDKPALLKRLARDPRLIQLFMDMGWAEDALPVLRQRARDRLPLDAASLALLAGAQDPGLNSDLAALVIRLDKGVEAVAAEYRGNPAFDWRSFASEGWKSRRYGDYQKEGWLYAGWAAEQGDPTAFRRLAERAALNKKWERDRLTALVPEGREDLIGYLRENIDRMEFDAGKKQWIARE
ncbi:MAG: hypothetical protein EOP85_03440 [Verrucomicrobiaceae bacterium]|nr:MAG: hypothetical protein EOP85_03440 [Verrucomicrobiaceae bacterium]